ncbi:MAG: hypothetical protein ACC652_11555, partial [Acidimicrobiales bacterium]
DRFSPIVSLLDPVPDAIIGLALVAISVGAVLVTGRRRSTNSPSQESDHDVESNEDETSKACH